MIVRNGHTVRKSLFFFCCQNHMHLRPVCNKSGCGCSSFLDRQGVFLFIPPPLPLPTALFRNATFSLTCFSHPKKIFHLRDHQPKRRKTHKKSCVLTYFLSVTLRSITFGPLIDAVFHCEIFALITCCRCCFGKKINLLKRIIFFSRHVGCTKIHLVAIKK